jgi:hypothetical protein
LLHYQRRHGLRQTTRQKASGIVIEDIKQRLASVPGVQRVAVEVVYHVTTFVSEDVVDEGRYDRIYDAERELLKKYPDVYLNFDVRIDRKST